MKQIILTGLIMVLEVFLFAGCENGKSYVQNHRDKVTEFKAIEGLPIDYFYVITVDSCEYVVYSGSYNGGIVHKANCKNH